MPCIAHMPVPRSQIGRPTEVGGPSGSPVACMIPPMPCAIRSKPPRISRDQSKWRRSALGFSPLPLDPVVTPCGVEAVKSSCLCRSVPTQSLFGLGLDWQLMPHCGQPQCSTDENGRLSHQTLFHSHVRLYK